ncbi:MBL fold metallo-hydrolase [Desulfurococcus amylolyticus]|uniref:Exonuclease of the beta-lactamase fold involved in RNA processing-like protein n=1 Tax=Desulfurococcus amylolyticus DSM 16532 TaxID=768672 RepID=I3XQ71_DESAM|nr:MBL fold metallo-hydrolase [Desulfurococcus amylolyticus]AFL66095.1 exonuclease of the beta-lactamase fold involved in RNA processing-like protein [Desulfurococcus amylolyticus DSM 16532]
MLSTGNYAKLLESINIRENGAVILGENTSIDGYAEKPVRVITHAHVDHLGGLEESIKYSKMIIATSITLDLIESLNYVDKYLLPYYRLKKKPLKYNECLVIDDNETLCLFQASHIPGAAQVYVEYRELRLGYTGDFKLDGKTQVMKDLDVLVMESTYGNPNYRRPFKDEVPELFASLVEEGLYRYKRVYVYGYHGKVQEAMIILREKGIEAPFILPPKIYHSTRVLEKHGIKIGNYMHEEDMLRGLNPGEKAVIFKHMNVAEYRRLDGSALHIVLSGWEFNKPFRRIDDYTYLVALSDHADFDDLVEYVRRGEPKLVVIDASREGDAWSLRNALIEAGYCAIVMPSANPWEQLNKCSGGMST